MSRFHMLAGALILAFLEVGSTACGYMPADAADPSAPGAGVVDGSHGTPTPGGANSPDGTPTDMPPVQAAAFKSTHMTGPARTVVSLDDGTWLATLTDGAHTVTLRGPARTITEPTSPSNVESTTWVRVLPQPYSGTLDDTTSAWLTKELSDTSPDVLETSFQYIAGAPPIVDDHGLTIAGAAGYGPLQADGTRQEGSDFNDYLGITITYPDGKVDAPETAQAHCLDCSGLMRMVWGYRSGLAMTLQTDGEGSLLPRRAVQIVDSGPGVVTVPNTLAQVTDLSTLAPGDLVFFDADDNDGTAIDHVGMFLGIDTAGRYRFISSRKTQNGPTFGDNGGASVLDGGGYYAKAFRAVRRL